MKLDLSDHVTKDEIYEHFELFKEAYAMDEYMSNLGYLNHDTAMEEEMDWFNENAPAYLPMLDTWVINHVRART